MATSAKALGDIQIAARDGHDLPSGTGLDKDGNATKDPAKVLEDVILPFGGYKGSAISLMVELLSRALVGQMASFRNAEADNGDGGPPPRGQMILALNPDLISEGTSIAEAEHLFGKLENMPGVRIPGARRIETRSAVDSVSIDSVLWQRTQELANGTVE